MSSIRRKVLTACAAADDKPQRSDGSVGVAGGTRAVVEALIDSVSDGVVGLVVDTSGSTYTKLGNIICISPSEGRTGWISGGCLESSLEEEAYELLRTGQAGVVEFDTRSDADLMFGTRIGCRGVVQLALLPLAQLSGIEILLRAWVRDAVEIRIDSSPTGQIRAEVPGRHLQWSVPWRDQDESVPQFQLSVAPAPRLLVFGGGPEAAVLVSWMRSLGWYVSLVERRSRWTSQLALADVGREMTPEPAVASLAPLSYTAAVVMNHDFELDREALESLAETDVPWIGLLGPARRRDDLLRLVGIQRTDMLRPRLHAPVGLPLGGRGPEAIALAIAAELHAGLNGRGVFPAWEESSAVTTDAVADQLKQ